jgi:hypothetical protein
MPFTATSQRGKPNRPLIITGKTNPLMNETITTTAWKVLQKWRKSVGCGRKSNQRF